MATDQSFYIRGTLIEPDGTALASADVNAYRLGGKQVAADLVDSTQYSADSFSATTNGSGVFAITVTHALASSGPLAYKVVFPDNKYAMVYFGVNDGSRTFDLGTISIESDPPKRGEINITPLVQKNMLEGDRPGAFAVAAASGVTIADSGIGNIHDLTVTLDAVSVSCSNTTGVSFGGTKILDFIAGQVYVLAAWAEGATTDGSTAGNNANILDGTGGGDLSYGTTAPTDGTLTGTDVDIVPSASADPLSGGAAAARLAAAATFDGTTTAKDVYVNMLLDDADVDDTDTDVMLISDTLHIIALYGGDD